MRFRLLAPSGQVLDEGEADVRVESGALVVTPKLGQPLRVRPLDVVETSEPAPYVVLLRLSEGPALELSQLGALRTQVLSDFATARTEDTAQALLLAGVGTPEKFPGAIEGIEGELRLYDDMLVAVPVSGEPRQLPYSFVDGVDTDSTGYKITVSAAGFDPVVVQRLAARTSEFVNLLHDRVNTARLRSATLISTLLPGLPSLASRSVAALLRDGVPAAVGDLDAVEATVSASVLHAATIEDRLPCVTALQRRGALWIALHQVTSVGVTAAGGGSLAGQPVEVRDHGGMQAAPGGFAGMATGALLRQGPNLFGIGPGGMPGAGFAAGAVGPMGMGPAGPMGMGPAGMGGDVMGGLAEATVLGSIASGGGLLGGGSPRSVGAQHEVMPRHVPQGGGADVAHTDYGQLSTSGAEPSVYAMVFTVVPDSNAIVYEVLNDPDHASYVYDLPPAAGGQAEGPPSQGRAADGVRALACALALIGFHVSAVYADASGADSKFRDAVERLPHLAMLRTAFRGRAIHTDRWEAQLDGLLAGR